MAMRQLTTASFATEVVEFEHQLGEGGGGRSLI